MYDVYQSEKQRSIAIVVPAGTDPTTQKFSDEANEGLAKLSPLVLRRRGVMLENYAKGDLFEHLQKQLAEHGVGLVRTSVSFRELG